MKMGSHYTWSFHNLLVWLLLYILFSPILAAFPSMHLLINVLMTSVLFSAVYVVNRRSKMFTTTILLMGLSLVFLWIDVYNLIPFSRLASSTLLCLYLGLLVYSMVRLIFSFRRITSALISASLCSYLIFGLFWGSLYYLLELILPGSFAGNLISESHNVSDQYHNFKYFSFVTLTTLGYGDIVPRTRIAASFCQIEAIIGQFFMAVLVARLVGIQVAQEFSSGN